MRFWRRDKRTKTEQWPARDRAASASRPRVARAIEAAHLAQAGVPRGVISPRPDAGALRYFEAVERAAASGPLHKARKRARRGLAPELVLATARAAQQIGRRPEEVWADALRGWLERQDTAPAPIPATLELRRRTVWRDIDLAMAGLRAS